MTFAAIWLANVLRSAGLPVVEEPGWETRGHGDMGPVLGVLCHHTGGALHGDAPSLDLIRDGRADLSGPLSHLCLARSGIFHVVAAGRCNHAGAGSWQGVTAGNSHLIGIEAENAGTGNDPWPLIQIDSYARGVAAILSHVGASALMCVGHKEYALPKGRKVDPTFDMDAFRAKVRGFLSIPVEHPHAAMLKRGDTGESVRQLQAALNIAVDGNFGPSTEAAVRAFQTSAGLAADGLVGPQTWKALDNV